MRPNRAVAILHSSFCILLSAVACMLMAGCRSADRVVAPRAPLEVKVVETESAKALDVKTAARLKLQAQYRRGVGLLDAGKAEEALRVLRGVAEEAAREGIRFSPQMEADLKRALSGKAPVPRKAQAKPAAPPAPPPPKMPKLPDATRPRPKKEELAEQPAVKPAERTPGSETFSGEVHLPALSNPDMADKLISMNFVQADIRIVLKTIADLTGANFVVDEKITGTVTLIAPTEVRLGEVYRVFESILEVKGYAAVPAGSVVKIVPRTEAAKRNLLTRVGSDPAAIPVNDSIVTQIIPLQFVNAAEISNLIAPLVATGAHVATYSQTNTILITDTSSNIHHIARIIGNLDVPGTQAELSTIQLKHASADEVCSQAAQIMAQTSVILSPRPKGARGGITTAQSTLKIMPDSRTNSLIVLASPKDTELIKDLVARLDVERPLEAGNIHVVYLEHAEAKDLQKPLSSAVAKSAKARGVKQIEPIEITADEGTNALIIIASPQDFKIIEDIIAKLDIVREQVLVEMCIAEASEDVLREMGIDWATLDEAVADSVRGFGYTNFGLRVESAAGDLEGLGIGLMKKVGTQTTIGAILKALESNSKVNILSTPHIRTSNHQEATIVVGENIPYVKESRITETDVTTPTMIRTYDYKDVGIELKITPHISQGGLVRLEIDTKFTKLIEGAAGVSADTPTTAKREAKTVISIMNGTMVVIGGLIRDDKVTVEKRVPVLGEIPLLGYLFRWNRDLVQKTNLLLFITPHVLADKEDLAMMTERKKAETLPRFQPVAK